MYYSMKNGFTFKGTPNDWERIEYIHGVEPKETMVHAYKRLGCDILINCNFFAMSTGATCGNVTDEGKVLSSGMSAFGYAFKDKKTPVFDYLNSTKAIDFAGFYPCLLKAGQQYIDTKEVGFSATSTRVKYRRGRTACGDANGTFVIRCIPDTTAYTRKTIPEMVTEMKNLGCYNAGGYDGGGSTQYITPWGRFISGRAVDGFIAIWLKKSPASDTSSITKKVTAKSGLRLRSQATTSSKTLTIVPYGTSVTVLSTSNGWCKVKYGAYSGYMSATYLK